MNDIEKSENFDPALVVPRPWEMLTEVQRAYIDWKALGGIITTDDGTRKMPLSELAQALGVTMDAFSKGKSKVPNFWDLVAERRKKIGGESRLAAMHDIWYLKAREMKDWRITEAWLRNHDDTYKESHSKALEDIGEGLSDMYESIRLKRLGAKKTPIEGEVVNNGD